MDDSEVIDRPKGFRPDTDGKVIDMKQALNPGRIPSPSEIAADPQAFLPSPGPAPETSPGGERLDGAKSDPMPESPFEPYRPHAGYLNVLQAREDVFYCLLKDGTIEGFPYSHFDRIRLGQAERPGGGPEIVVRFNGSDTEAVHLEWHGPGMRYAGLCIGKGTMPWVWEMPDGLTLPEGAPAITRITIVKVKRE